MPQHPSEKEKIRIFWSKVKKTKTCWLWIGRLQEKGYGKSARINGEVRTHRVSWTLANGPIPKDLKILHKCDVRNCVRPTHLFIGTTADNQRDAQRKGRMRSERLLASRANPVFRKSQSEKVKLLWRDPSYRAMQMKARGLD